VCKNKQYVNVGEVSGLFCLANISYERLCSRRLLISRGLLNLIPSIYFWWFILSACNIAAPPSLNLLGEIRLLNRLISWSWFRIFFNKNCPIA
jgi:NADH-ubiquinone oxidoreductase chain 4